MFTGNAIILLAAAGVATASVIAERVPMMGAIEARSILQGWSIQASSAPAGTVSCGSGSFCPSSLTCDTAANDEVAACCSSGDCRGSLEGSPACADSAWSLWKGLDGNGFCCAVGDVGIYDYHNTVAGTCVKSAPADATTAVLMSTGSGSGPASATSAPAAKSSAAAAAATTTTAAAGSSPTSAASVASSAATKPSGSTSSPVSSAVASASSVASPAASGNTTSTPTTSSSTTKSTSGAERMVGGASLLAVGLMAVLAL